MPLLLTGAVWVCCVPDSLPSLLRLITCLSPVDVTDIKFVVNFDFPNNTEDYIHRIGRTARADNTGTAYSFFTSSNAKQARELIDILKEAKQSVPPRLYHMLELSKQIHMAKSELCNRTLEPHTYMCTQQFTHFCLPCVL